MKPPFAYFGGKTTIAERVADLLPAHRHYVEPFAGSLAVLLAKPPALMETANDLDGDIVHFWRMLRERPADLARACALTPHARAEWESCRGLDPVEDDIDRARRLWVLLTQSRAGRIIRTGWRHYVSPAGVGTAFPGYLDGYVDRMAAVAERLHHVSLECRPAVELIERYGSSPDVLLYVDPPYLGSTRSNERSYRHELISDEEHAELAEYLLAAKSAVVLSAYRSPLYELLYDGWHHVEILTGTGQGPNGWKNRTEVLWSNRPLGAMSLFDEEASA